MKRAFEYRFCPTDAQAAELSRTFGCVRLVHDRALAHRTPAKVPEPLQLVWSRPLPESAEPSTVTVSRDSAGRWFVSVLCEEVVDHLPASDQVVGVDAGITSLLTLSTGEYGRELVVVDRFLPSSELCSACGALQEKLPLNVRERTCGCGVTHDRDVDAAVDIEAAWPAASAWGAGVRPQRESSRTGRPAMKQETQRATAGTPSPQGEEEVKRRRLPSSGPGARR